MDDQVTNTAGSEESVSIETSNSAPLNPNKLMVKLKISKNSLENSYGASNQHVCPVCSKGFMSGKALGGHIRIHMIKGRKNGSHHRKISKRQPRSNAKSKKKNSNIASLACVDDQNQENNEKVSCCICNKDFKSMKSLFGHMRNHPERNWRGIRPPPSDENSCCPSVSENDEAYSDIKSSSSVSDLVKSLPNSWSNTGKRFDKSSSSSDHDDEEEDDDDDEVPEAAYCLMKLSRGHSFDLYHSKTKTKNTSSLDKASELKGKAKVKTECEFLTKELNGYDRIFKNNRFSGQFKKISLKPDPYRGQRSGFYPKTPRYEAADHGSQVCSVPKVQLDFDLNELPYVEGLDGDDQA